MRQFFAAKIARFSFSLSYHLNANDDSIKTNYNRIRMCTLTAVVDPNCAIDIVIL
jgi:hypothetical protein